MGAITAGFTEYLASPVLGGCLGGGIGSLATSWCSKGSISICDLVAAVSSTVAGCFAGWATTGVEKKVENSMNLLLGLWGVDLAIYSSYCKDGDAPTLAFSQYACCTFSGMWGEYKKKVKCPLERTPFGCCMDKAIGWFVTHEVMNAKRGECK